MSLPTSTVRSLLVLSSVSSPETPDGVVVRPRDSGRGGGIPPKGFIVGVQRGFYRGSAQEGLSPCFGVFIPSTFNFQSFQPWLHPPTSRSFSPPRPSRSGSGSPLQGQGLLPFLYTSCLDLPQNSGSRRSYLGLFQSMKRFLRVVLVVTLLVWVQGPKDQGLKGVCVRHGRRGLNIFLDSRKSRPKNRQIQ